jgi:hypothetical protein
LSAYLARGILLRKECSTSDILQNYEATIPLFRLYASESGNADQCQRE